MISVDKLARTSSWNNLVAYIEDRPHAARHLVLDSEPVLYSVVERVIEADVRPEAPITPVNPILEDYYYSWVQASKAPYYLADILGREQYMTGRLASTPSGVTRRYLVDIDPYMWSYGPAGHQTSSRAP